MPQAFIDCTKTKGSRVRTKELGSGKYLYLCFLPGSDKGIASEVHQRKNPPPGDPIKGAMGK